MIFKRLILKVLSLVIVVNSTDLSIEEKIKLHREWLQKNTLHKPIRTVTYDKNFLNSHKYVTNKLKSETKNGNKESFLKKSKLLLKEDYSRNDVYPQIEKERIVTTSENYFSSLPTTTTPIYNTSTTIIHQSTENYIITSYPSTTKNDSKLSDSFKEKKHFYWSTWSNWSECSRSCGGGIMYQTRKCISRKNSNIISNECVGVYKRYHLCNEEKCPKKDNEFRYQQCSYFNDVLFQGKKYQWEPYIKDDAECELNCKPIGMKYFATLNKTVIDGTSCTRPAEYYRKNYRGLAVCVDGICKV